MASSDPTRFLGIEIGGTKLQAVVGDAAGRIERRWRAAVERAAGAEGILQQLEAGMRQLLSHGDCVAVGIGFGGPIDWRTGTIARSHQIGGWDGFALMDWARRVSGRPVAVDNDANVAALGEALAGAGRGADPVFYVTLGSGVGGGLITGKRIYHGAPPGEAEIGHVRLDRSGTIVEQRCSGWAVDARIRELAGTGSALRRLIGDQRSGEAQHLRAALAEGDPVARRILDELADDLAFALSHVTHLFHPEVIILGGGLSLIGAPLRQAVEERLPRWTMAALGAPPVRQAALGEDSVPVGALLLAAGHTEP
jgi:glucokinase